MSTPVRTATQPPETLTPEVEEWSKYPPFPSAYPATPQSQDRNLSQSSSTGLLNGVSSIGADDVVELEVEEWRKYEPFPSAYPPTPEIVARTIAVTKSTSRQPALDPVEEQKTEVVESSSDPSDEIRDVPVQRREMRRPTRPKPTASQSLPSRTGRRRGNDLSHANSYPKDPKSQDFHRRPSGRVSPL